MEVENWISASVMLLAFLAWTYYVTAKERSDRQKSVEQAARDRAEIIRLLSKIAGEEKGE